MSKLRWPSLCSPVVEDEIEFEKFIPAFTLSKKEDEHIVYGIVYEPDTVDAQGDMASEEEIRKAAYHFMEKVQTFKVNHSGSARKVRVLESYITPSDLTIKNRLVKKGSWVMVTRILDNEIWGKIKSGELTGYSMAGYARTG